MHFYYIEPLKFGDIIIEIGFAIFNMDIGPGYRGLAYKNLKLFCSGLVFGW